MAIRFSIHFDGAVRSNKGQPDKIGWGFVVWLGDQEIHCACGTAGFPGTSNIAEWTALMLALSYCVELEEGPIKIYGDSQVIINQFNGVFKIRKKEFLPYYTICSLMADKLVGRVTVDWVPREHLRQKRADKLSKEGLLK